MKKNRSVVRAVRILELLANESKGLSLSEVAARVDIPITSANDIIKALLDEEMIELIDERSKIYGIGVKAFFIGNTFIKNTSLVDKAKDAIEKLSHQTKKTVFLGKEINGKITYIYKYEPKETLVATCAIGSRTSLHCTSLGKSFLAFNDGLLESLKGRELLRSTDSTITDYDKLLDEIRQVRIKGYAVDDREQNDHLLCIGAPVFDNHNNVIAAVSISGLYKGDENIPETGELVKQTAFSISRSLGYR